MESLKVHEDALETFERKQKHLANKTVDLQKTPLTLGATLRMKPGHEEFVGNDQANALLTREYRKPFVVPAENEI